MRSLDITDVVFTRATISDVRSGLLGYISCTLNGSVGLDGITLRRKMDGQLALSFPARRDRYGIEHPYLWPLDDGAGREIEQRVLAQINFEEVAQ